MTHPKAALNAFCQNKKLPQPKFETRGTGTDEEPLFISDVTVGEELVATGQGRNKREAERTAAELALEQLRSRHGEAEPSKRKRRRKPRGESRPANAENTASGWNVYPEVLAEALRVAEARLPQKVKGDVREELARFAADIYKSLLEELGLSG